MNPEHSISGILPIELLEVALSEYCNKDNVVELENEDNNTHTISFLQNLHARAIETTEDMLVDDDLFFELADKMSSFPKLTFDLFGALQRQVPESLRRHFKSSNFLFFCKDLSGEINTDEFLRFIQRSIDVERTYLHLLRFCQFHGGFRNDNYVITEREFERYLFSLIPEMSCCKGLDVWFYPYYVFAASRRFLFFLDQRHTKTVNIKKLAHSTVMEELLFLKRLSQYEKDMDPQIFQSQVESNWFDGGNAMKMYRKFISLDRDQNGTLSSAELLHFTGSSQHRHVQFTSLAVDRLIEVHVKYSPPTELDFKGFVDLLLAIDNKTHASSLDYFWKILDIDNTGHLTPRAIRYFYADIFHALRRDKYDAPPVEPVILEIFDILKCNSSQGPTFSDFKSSGQGGTVASMLLDVNGFWQYDNRENLMQQADSQDQDQEGGDGHS